MFALSQVGLGQEYPFAQVIGDVFSLYKRTDRYTSYRRQIESAEISIRSANLYDRWGVSSRTFREDRRPLELKDETLWSRDYFLANEVKYDDEVGVDVTFATNHQYSRKENQPVLTATGPENQTVQDKTHSYRVTVSYEAIKEGEDGLTKISRSLEELRAMSSIESTKSEMLDDQFSLAQLLTSFYATKCRLQQLGKTIGLVEKTLKTGKILRDTDTLSMKDYLNIENLALNFNRRLATQKTSLETTLAQFEGYGIEIRKYMESLRLKEMACLIDAKLIFEGIESLHSSAKKKIRKHPRLKAARLNLRIAKKIISQSELNNNFSLAPYVQFDWTPQIDRKDESGKSTVGVVFNWTPPISRGIAIVEKAKADLDAAQSRLQVAKDSLAANLAQIGDQLESQRRFWDFNEEAVGNSQKLVKIIDVELTTGAIDTVNYTNAYIQLVDAILSRYDIWSTMENLKFQLVQYDGLK